MTDAKYTPGPWRFEQHRAESQWLGNIIGGYGKNKRGIEVIRTISCQTRYGDYAEGIANAHLIAAAPELLEALKKIVIDEENRRKSLKHREAHDLVRFCDKRLEAARAAIRKAEGRS